MTGPKLREFYLSLCTFNDGYIEVYECKDTKFEACPPASLVHVIEKQAYDQLLEEHCKLKAKQINGTLRTYDGLALKYDELLEEAKRLAEALAEMQHESSEVAEAITRWQEYIKEK